MAIKVIVNNANFNQKVLGVKFTNGKGIFEDEEKGRLFANRFGYAIKEVKKEEKKPFENVDKDTLSKADLKRLTKKELQELLDEKNVEYKEEDVKQTYIQKLLAL